MCWIGVSLVGGLTIEVIAFQLLAIMPISAVCRTKNMVSAALARARSRNLQSSKAVEAKIAQADMVFIPVYTMSTKTN